MKVIVQQIGRNLFLRGRGEWTESRAQARRFATALDAISMCIRYQMKEVRLIGQDADGRDVHLYPFGGDPAVRLQLKQLRRSIRESQRIKSERRVIRARIDILMAEGKEKKKQFPFKREAIGEEDLERPGAE